MTDSHKIYNNLPFLINFEMFDLLHILSMWFDQSALELFTTRLAGAHNKATTGPQRRGNSFKRTPPTLNKYCDLTWPLLQEFFEPQISKVKSDLPF